MRSDFTAAPSGRAEVSRADAWLYWVLRSLTTPWSWLTAPSTARRAAALAFSRVLTAAASPGPRADDGDGDDAVGEEAAGRPGAGLFARTMLIAVTAAATPMMAPAGRRNRVTRRRGC